MMKTIKPIWIHLAIIGLTGLYFFISPTLYTAFFRQHGKPAPVTIQLPAAANQLIISPLELTPTWVEDEDVYELNGWGFAWDLSHTYRRFFVLEAGKTNYYFPIETYSRPDLNSIFVPEVSPYAGLKAVIALNAVPIGTYRIGVLFTNDPDSYYIQTNQVLSIAANKMSIARFNNWFENENLSQGIPVTISEPPTESLKFNLDPLSIAANRGQACIHTGGYVFSEAVFEQQPKSVSLLLDTGTDITAYPTLYYHRPDVPIYYARADMGDPGFLGCIPIEKLSEDGSRVGLRLTFPNEEVYQWTDLLLSKDQDAIYNHAVAIGTP